MKQELIRTLLTISRLCLRAADALNGPRPQKLVQPEIPLAKPTVRALEVAEVLRRFADQQPVTVQELMTMHHQLYALKRVKHRLAFKVNDFVIVLTRRPAPKRHPQTKISLT